MNKYIVVTPAYDTVVPILDDGTGPIETGADVLEIEADSKETARIIAVQLWRKEGWRNYIMDSDSNEECPFSKLKVYNADKH